MRVLVTGGAGYIGGFMARRLLADNIEVIVADSLERGHKEVIPDGATVKIGDLREKSFLHSVFHDHQIDAVVHFAAYISMAESMREPGMYFQNNTHAIIGLLEAMQEHHVKQIIFSSTAGVYGNPSQIPIPENHSKKPENPYGESKLMSEHILTWYQKIHGISFAALRYFNAAGAAMDGAVGEQHDPETHIIPNAIQALLSDNEFTLFGGDYDTSDGTCVRDYIHVLDLVDAHMLALQKLEQKPGAYRYNIGTGNGYSNKEVIATIEKISGKRVRVKVAGRRPGDAAKLIADPQKIQKELGFSPKYSDLETIVRTAWEWHSRNSK